MNLKNKILLILLALISFILLNATNCFAATSFTFQDGEKNVELNLNDSFDSVSEHIVILKNSDSTDYLVYLSSTEIYLNYNGSLLDLTTNSRLYRYSYSNLQDSSLELSGIGLSSDSSMISFWTFLTSNKTTYTSEAHDDIFYESISVTPESPDSNTILDKSIKTEDLDGVFYEILLILPACILIIIGFIAIRKGIAFLKNLLHKA